MEGVGRLAISALHGHGGWMATLRPVVAKAPAWKDLGLPARVAAWPDFTSGMLVVASAAGHGKTTTVASLVDAWTQQHARHVVMFQQPVEVVHHAQKGVVTQVEVALDHMRIVDTLALVKHSQAHAVVLDLKDPGHTVTAALELAMASTLTVVTLDVQSVTDVVRRLLLEHPGHAQQAVRRWLQTHLRGVLVQRWKTPARQELEFEWAVQSPVLDEMLRGEVVKELAAAVRPSELPDVAQAFPS
jgi:twitching motility protein PilT